MIKRTVSHKSTDNIAAVV